MPGQYQGSQAFNQLDPFADESVNPNTGSLNFSVPLVKLQGKNKSIDLNVSLFYSAGFRGTFGLPQNWGLNLPYVLGNSVTTSGRTYVIDPEWSDVTRYESGLKYTNNHGIKFTPVSPPLPLPSGLHGEYAYQLKNADGSMEYFDIKGKPLERHDIHGNYLHYTFITGDQHGIDEPSLRVDEIIDSWGQTIKFTYEQGSEMTIKLPDGGVTVVKFSQDGVYRIIDPAGRKTELEYVPFGDDQQLLGRIEYPSGLISTFEYTSIQYLNQDGSPGRMSAVEHFRHLDSTKKVYRHYKYIYGEESTNTYTGASIGCKLGGLEDTLMDNYQHALDYRYDVARVTLDSDERPIARCLTWFNNLHLAVEEINYLFDEQRYPVDATKTVLTYSIDRDKRARVTSYFLPIRTEAFHNIASLGSTALWRATTRTDAEYDSYGNSIKTTEWISTDGTGYTERSSVKTEYSTTKKGVQIAVKIWTTDMISRTVEYKEQKPTDDGRSIASSATWFQDGIGSGAQLLPWKEVLMKYDESGRLVNETTAWIKGAQVPEGSLSSVTSKFEYSRVRGGILSITETSARGDRTVVEHDVRRSNAPIIKKTLPLGQSESFEYDIVGRVIKHGDALGQQTTTVYSDGPVGTSKTVTTPLKYSQKTSYDVLGREVEVSDNGDPTVPFMSQPSRVLSRNKYNCLALQEETLDKFGMTTKYKYDGLGRPVTITDPHGNVVSYKYYEGGQRVTESINGNLRKETNLDALSRVLREVKYPDTDDKSTTSRIMHEYVYNGSGEVIERTLSRTDGTSSKTRLETEVVKYGPTKTLLSRTLIGFTERGKDTVTRRFVLDLFNNHSTYTKETVYSDGRSFRNQGPTRIYNEINKLVIHRNQEGKEERHHYNANGWDERTVRFDGTEIKYKCDNNGQVTRISYPLSTTEHSFDADRRLVQTREGGDVIKYSRSLDGSITGQSYGDGRTQSIRLDKFSRIVQETDVFGIVKETEYTSFGLVARRKCQGDIMTYNYGTVNHTYNQHLGYKFSGSEDYTRSITYDGFGRVRQNTARVSGSSAVLLETTYELDARQKVIWLKSSSAVFPEQRSDRRFLYDGLGQMTQETHAVDGQQSITKYAYDGNANVLSVDVDGQTTSMTYNKIDQRTDRGFTYDANGRLLEDNEGLKYVFDERDRLLSVSSSSDTPTKFAYHSDSHLAQKNEGDTDAVKFYHNNSNKKIDTFHETKREGQVRDTKTSFLSDSDTIIAGYTNGRPSDRFLDQLNSTVLILGGAGKHVSAKYGAYGASKLRPPSGNLSSSFGFTQAFTDEKRGLVYLGSRFYNPRQMSFVSMDTYVTENRYAYCDGDPVNRIDPTGHFWAEVIPTVLGIAAAVVAGAIFTAVTGGAGSPVAMAVISGAISGAVGSATTLGLQAAFGRRVTGGDFVTALLVGGIGGAITGGLGKYFQGVAKGNFYKAILGGAATGGAAGGVKEAIIMIRSDKDFSVGRLALGIVQGALIGLASGYWARRTYIRETALKNYQAQLEEMKGRYLYPDIVLQ
ncbi:hypothetical protein TWF481_005670 [Arthrobotrys musiformis]|uniref:RHS repeat-associated core domain-containing protein n=1 Tax=Arthrobotrys musiformis TaxID=47236 RepID=A0AAV9WGJ5_9PEZI